MILHDLPRRSGKTTMLLRRLEVDPSTVLLVPSYAMATYLWRDHPTLKERIWSFEQALTRRNKFRPNGRNAPTFIIDELDQCLSYILGGNVLAATTSSLEFA